VFDVRRTTRFGGEIGWTPCGSAARLPDAGLRRFTLRSRAAGATALSPTITSTGPPASRGAARGGDARVRFAAAGPGAFPTRARFSGGSAASAPVARPEGPSGDAPRRETSGGGGGVRRRGVRRRRRCGARRVFVRRRERSAGRRNRQSPGRRRRHLFLGRGSLLGRRLERGVGVLDPGGRVLVVVAEARDRLREVRRARRRGRRRGEPERRPDPRVERRGARDGIRTRTDPRHGNDNRSLRVRYLNGLLPNVLAFLDAPLGPGGDGDRRVRAGHAFARSPARLGGARLGLVGGVDAHGGGRGRGRVEVGDAPVVLALLRAREPGRRVQRVTDLALPVLVRGQVPRPAAVCRTSRGRQASAKRPKRVSFRWIVREISALREEETRRPPTAADAFVRGGGDGQRGRAGR